MGAPRPLAVAGAAFHAASLASPSLRANSEAFCPTYSSRTRARTSSSGRVLAGVYCTTRPAASWLGPTSTASVLRLFCTESEEKSASRNLGLASGPTAPGAGVRVRPDAVCTLSLSLSATGLRLSACSYTLFVNDSATSANLRWACCCLSSASMVGRSSSKEGWRGALISVSWMMW
ncbi:hypothetical protein D3C71_868300 [compost metagenome]